MNKAAFEAHCRMDMDGLYRIALSIVRNDADAQDAVQQGLMKAWISREKSAPAMNGAILPALSSTNAAISSGTGCGCFRRKKS